MRKVSVKPKPGSGLWGSVDNEWWQAGAQMGEQRRTGLEVRNWQWSRRHVAEGMSQEGADEGRTGLSALLAEKDTCL